MVVMLLCRVCGRVVEAASLGLGKIQMAAGSVRRMHTARREQDITQHTFCCFMVMMLLCRVRVLSFGAIV
jgi:hypothetical protein